MIDDDVTLGVLLREYFDDEDLGLTVCLTGEEGIEMIKRRSFGLVILDVMLPGSDGFEALKSIRKVSSLPVLMLTTRGATSDRVKGLRTGADDYLPKPFEPAELLARIRSILRRVYPRVGGLSFLLVDDLELDARRRTVFRNGELIELTGSEFSLLRLLLSDAGKVLAREQLVHAVLEREITAVDRGIDNLVSNLRKKLGPSFAGKDRIQSVRGIGYVYVIAASPVSA